MIDSESTSPTIDWQARALSAEAKLARAKVAIVCILERVTELEGLTGSESGEPASVVNPAAAKQCEICERLQDASNRFACHRPQGETRECYETAFSKLRGRASMLDQELRHYRRENGEQITITLDGYERANLLWLIGLIGYQGEALKPFDAANTGDWVGQIYWKAFGEGGVSQAPNVSRDQMPARVRNAGEP